MERRRLIIIIGIIVVLVGAGVFLFLQNQASNSAKAATAARQTGTITRGALTATVTGAGNIFAPQQSNLSFQVANQPISKVNVKVGDQVTAGDVLAEVDDSDLQAAYNSAQAQLASAQASLDALKAPPTADDLTTAQAQVKSTQTAYDAAVAKLNALQHPSTADLHSAQAQLASAQAAYTAAVNSDSHSSDQITVAKAALNKAKVALDSAQAAYDKVAWRSDVGASTEAATLQSATIDYQSALASFNIAAAGINDTGVKSAAQTLAAAQATYANLTKPSADALAAAQSTIDSAAQSLSSAKTALNKLTAGATADQLASAQATLESAQAADEQAKHNLDNAKIVAPFDGTVGAVNYVVGQPSPAAGTTVITLVNLNNLQTQITLSEVDIPKVKPNQPVALAFDALGGRSLPGKVISISPIGTVTSGVVNYLVTVGLVQPNPQVKPGMTTTAAITVDSRDNVVMVPNRAVRTQGNQKMITVLFEGKEIPVLVQTGLNNDQNTEIVSATSNDGQPLTLQDGDTVLLNTTASNRGFGGPGGPGGGFILGGGRPPGD